MARKGPGTRCPKLQVTDIQGPRLSQEGSLHVQKLLHFQVVAHGTSYPEKLLWLGQRRGQETSFIPSVIPTRESCSFFIFNHQTPGSSYRIRNRLTSAFGFQIW